MGFEPHSVAGSALKLASRLPLRGPAPSCAPHERGTPLSESPVVGSSQECIGLTFHFLRLMFHEFMERAMGFEPTTTCLGSKDSNTELRPLTESNPTLAQEPSQSSVVIGQSGRKHGGSSQKHTSPLTTDQ